MTLNTVTRGDLRARLTSSKGVWVLRAYVVILALLVLLALPPEGSRLAQFQETDLMQAFLAVQLLMVLYATSALGVGEITVEGEKALEDLAATSFGTGRIARGKVWAAMLFAPLMVLVAAPVAVLLAVIRDAAPGPVMAASLMMVPVAGSLASLAPPLAAAVPGDLPRTFLHWVLIILVVVAPRWFGDAVGVFGPLGAVAAAYRGTPSWWPLIALPYLVLAAVAAFVMRRIVTRFRLEALRASPA